MREIEIIKKLSHRHIIRLIGTYTHGPFLGLLLWPVATCDLASVLEDVDWLQEGFWYWNGLSPELPEDWMEQRGDREARLRALGLTIQNCTELFFGDDIVLNRDLAVVFLKKTVGCIASAVAYLHASNIKHKDLKPSNILLSKDGLWLTDFGTATDFSVLTSSVTNNGERGTPKYFAPEIANFEPSGRSADVFSMGCILFEIMTLCIGHTLELSKRLRQSKDRSFQSNLGAVMAWFDKDEWITAVVDKYLLGLVRWMMLEEAHERPTADVVENEIAMISSLGIAYCFQYAVPPQPGVYRDCCNPDILHSHRTIMRATVATEFAINVTIGTAALGLGQGETCTFYIKSVDETYIESVHMFLVSVSEIPSLQGCILNKAC
jgi:serine/threonine protein kinase